MAIQWETLSSANLSACIPLWSDRATYTAAALERALARLRQLLDERRAIGALITEQGVVRGFGVTVFARRELIDRRLAEPVPQLGKHLLLEEGSAAGGVLTRAQIGEGNAANGLDLTVLSTDWDPDARDPDGVLGAIIAAYQSVHRGYQIARLINEVIGEQAVEFVTTSASFDLHARFTDVGGVRGLPGALFVLTREQAALRRNPLMAMFVYSPPRIGFTEAEQDVLRVALPGWTDVMIADRLGVPLTAVKSRWSRIQERALDAAPDLFTTIASPRVGGIRGPQSRHVILEYVRQNPAELTPYAPSPSGMTSEPARRRRAGGDKPSM